MPFTKVFGTADGAYSTETLWRKISVRTPVFKWTQSGATNEYYVTTQADTDPGFISSPTTALVFLNGSAATKNATLGSLTAGQFGFGDNDTLGFDTLYVRLADDADPDSKVLDWVQFQQSPKASEHVRFDADSGSITSATGLDQSGVAIGDFIVEEGCESTFGSESLGYLSIDPDRFEFSGNGEAWINLHTAAVAPQVYKTAAPEVGNRGLYLKGSALTVVNIMGGSVGIASRPGETATATTVRVLGSGTSLWLGNGVTLTNLHQYDGETEVRCSVTTTILFLGKMFTSENGAMTTVTQRAGDYTYQSTGNITTYNIYGGTLDLQKSGAVRTISTLNKYLPGGRVLRNKEAVTITSEVAQDTYAESWSA